MKNVFTILAVGLTINLINAQTVKETEVPTAVKNAFTKQHPTAKVEKQEKEEDNYEAEFMLNKLENSAVYDANGNLIQYEIEIPVTEQPKTITDFIAKKMPGKKINEVDQITDSKGNISFEVEVDDLDYTFDSIGNLIKKEERK